MSRRLFKRTKHLCPLGCARLRRDDLPQHIRIDRQCCDFLRLFMHSLTAHLRRNHQTKRHSQRAKRRLLNMLSQFKQRRQNRRIILQRIGNILYALRRQVAFLHHFHHDALQLSRSERHMHPHTGAKRHALGYAIGEYAIHILMVDIHDHLTKHPAPSFFNAS